MVLMSLIGAWSAIQGGATLTMEEAVEIATQRAFSVRQQLSAIEKSRQKVRESEGGLGPRVSISGTYTRYPKEESTEIGPGQSIVTQPLDNKIGTASLQLPIDISGNIGRIVRASKANLMASRETLSAVRNDVKLAVRRNFLNVLRTEEQIDVAKLALQEAEDRLKNAKLELEAGTKAKIDVIRIEAQVAQAQSDLIAATNQRTLAKQALNNTMGRPIETEFTAQRVPSLPSTPTSEVDEIDKVAQGNRPEAKALLKTQEALAFVRRATERGVQPTLLAALNFQKNFDAQGFTALDQTVNGTLTLNWPLYDSGVTRAQVGQARQDEEQAKIQLEQVRLGISLEVRQAMTNMVNASARLAVAERQLTAAEENYRISKVRLASGEGITLEITDALTQLTQARTGVVSARYDYWTAYSELQRAVGSDDLGILQGAKN